MADLRLLAVVLGLLPFLALALYASPREVAARRHAAWGALVGIVAFLGLSHGMAAALVDSSLLSRSVHEGFLVLPVAAFALGGIAAWWLLERPSARRSGAPSRIAWAGVLYLAIHSIADGLVLGQSFVGPVSNIPVDAVTVSATVLHRLAEGAIVVVPAILGAWRLPRALGALAVGLLVVPGAAAVPALSAGLGAVAAVPVQLAAVVVASAAEAGFALVLILTAYVPQASESGRARWIAWAAVAFLAILAVHELVE